MIYIGIDNGVTGGIAALYAGEREPYTWGAMPVKKSRTGKEVDVRAFYQWVKIHFRGQERKLVFILEEPGGSKSAAAAKSMAGSFHALRGCFEAMGYRWERITPQSWQKVMIPGCKAGETKKRALARVSELWPSQNFIPPGCRKPHEGVIDAALIAEYGRRKNL